MSLEIASQIQSGLMPQIPDKVPGYDVFGCADGETALFQVGTTDYDAENRLTSASGAGTALQSNTW